MRSSGIKFLLITACIAILAIVIVRMTHREDPGRPEKELKSTTESHSIKDHEELKDSIVNPTLVLLPEGLELPACEASQIVRHVGYSLQYDEGNEQAKWVAYQLTGSETVKRFKRTDNFAPDPDIATGSATDLDYRRSGYDRGHLAPAADMGWSSQSMIESFYYSNMSPQVPGFNRGIWKRLEEQVRNWAVELDTIYVVTGPVLTGKMSYLGPEHVAVPNYYYKAILYVRGKDARMLGFVMPNRASRNSLDDYTVSVDSIEKLTGLDLYAGLENAVEASLESTVCIACWNWSAATSHVKASEQESQSVQCSGITRAGRRCKRMTRNANGRCYQHQ